MTSMIILFALCLSSAVSSGNRVLRHEVIQDSIWHRSFVLRDVTGDGRADSLSLLVLGMHVDSLRVRLHISSQGVPIHSDTWGSIAYFHYPSNAPDRRWTTALKLEQVNRAFATFFVDSAFAPVSEVESIRGERALRSMIGLILGATRRRDSLLATGMSAAAVQQATQGRPVVADTARARVVWGSIKAANPMSFGYWIGAEDVKIIAWSPQDRGFFLING